MTSIINELKAEWHQLEANIHFIENLIPESEGENVIISIAEEIRIVNADLQRLTIKTLNTLLNVQENFNICPRCLGHMDVIDNDLVCENPSCPTNEYVHGKLYNFRRREEDRRQGKRRTEDIT